MKQVVCINPKRYRLTQGGEYTVANNPVRGFYNVENDNGSIRRYSAELFRDVPNEDTADVALNTLRITRTEAGVISISITVDNQNYSTQTSETLGRITCSCGIHSINAITTMLNFVQTLPDRQDLRVRVLARFIQYCTQVRDIGAMLISTNINCANYAYLPQAVAHLRQNGFIINETFVDNPNSGNTIVIYTVVVTPVEGVDYDELEEEDDVEDIVDLAQLEEDH